MKCGFCGAELDTGDQYCPACGRSASPLSQAEHTIPGSAEEIPTYTEEEGLGGSTGFWAWIKVIFSLLAIVASGAAIFFSFTSQAPILSDKECALSMQIQVSTANGGKGTKNFSSGGGIFVSVLSSVTNTQCAKEVHVNMLNETGNQVAVKSSPLYPVRGAATDLGDMNAQREITPGSYLIVCHYGDYEAQRLTINVY